MQDGYYLCPDNIVRNISFTNKKSILADCYYFFIMNYDYDAVFNINSIVFDRTYVYLGSFSNNYITILYGAKVSDRPAPQEPNFKFFLKFKTICNNLLKYIRGTLGH